MREGIVRKLGFPNYTDEGDILCVCVLPMAAISPPHTHTEECKSIDGSRVLPFWLDESLVVILLATSKRLRRVQFPLVLFRSFLLRVLFSYKLNKRKKQNTQKNHFKVNVDLVRADSQSNDFGMSVIA